LNSTHRSIWKEKLAVNQPPIVIGLGELLWDCFEETRRPGGAPANVAFQANQLGFRGYVCSRVGKDPDGEELLDFLSSQGLSTDTIQIDDHLRTGWVTIDSTESSNPQYTIHENVAWDALAISPLWQGLFESASAVCFGSLAQRSNASHETIQALLGLVSSDCLRVFDVNLRQEYFSREIIEQSLHHCEVLKLNDQEVPVVSELLSGSPKSIGEFADFLLKEFPVRIVCVTQGARGCTLCAHDETVEVPGTPVEVADSVGAGDAFSAGLIFGLLNRFTLTQAGQFANRIGGLVASRAGAMPDLRSAFQSLTAESGSD
jgi:fructokinase